VRRQKLRSQEINIDGIQSHSKVADAEKCERLPRNFRGENQQETHAARAAWAMRRAK